MNKSRRPWWIGFGALSSLLFTGYFIGLSRRELQPYLKGLNTLQHFSIHYTVGVVVALLACVIYLVVSKRRPNEPRLLLIFIMLSHEPDIRFAIRGLPHDKWEIIFLGHTVVDNYFYPLIWVFLALSIVLTVIYKRLISSYHTIN